MKPYLGEGVLGIRAVLFDLDGTILDISERDAFARYEALSCLGFDFSLDEVRQHYRYGIGLMGILKELNISLTHEEVEDYLNARFSSFTKKENVQNLTRIHKGAADALASLSQKYELVLVTSRGNLSRVVEELEWFKIRRYFTLIVTRDIAAKYYKVEVIPLLPFQEQRRKLYEYVIGVMKSDPNNLVCIGDSVGELEPAKKLGMTAIGVLTGISGKKDLGRVSDFTIRDITQVNDVLSRMN